MTPDEMTAIVQRMVDELIQTAVSKHVDPGCIGTVMFINAMGLMKKRYGTEFLKVAVSKALERFG